MSGLMNILATAAQAPGGTGGLRIVGISDMAVSNQPGETLVTYSLGSCVGLTLYDPLAHVGGLVHCMLPLSRLDPKRAEQCPLMFVDTGVITLLRAVVDLGAKKSNLVAKVAGAARLLDAGDMFRIGARNYVVLQRVLEKNNISLAAEDVGGTKPRTMYLKIGTGETIIRALGKEVLL